MFKAVLAKLRQLSSFNKKVEPVTISIPTVDHESLIETFERYALKPGESFVEIHDEPKKVQMRSQSKLLRRLQAVRFSTSFQSMRAEKKILFRHSQHQDGGFCSACHSSKHLRNRSFSESLLSNGQCQISDSRKKGSRCILGELNVGSLSI